MTALTKREKEIWEFIKAFKAYMPNYKDIQYSCGIGRGSLNRILDRLVTKGKLERVPTNQIKFRIKDARNSNS